MAGHRQDRPSPDVRYDGPGAPGRRRRGLPLRPIGRRRAIATPGGSAGPPGLRRARPRRRLSRAGTPPGGAGPERLARELHRPGRHPRRPGRRTRPSNPAVEPGRDPTRLRRYFESLALNTAGTVTEAIIFEAGGVNRKTADAYERLLTTMFLTEALPSWTSNRLQRLSARPKRYVADPALAAALLRVDELAVLREGEFLGRLLDTFLASQLRAELPVAQSEPRLCHVREEHGRQEIDLVAELGGGHVIAPEVKPRRRRHATTPDTCCGYAIGCRTASPPASSCTPGHDPSTSTTTSAPCPSAHCGADKPYSAAVSGGNHAAVSPRPATTRLTGGSVRNPARSGPGAPAGTAKGSSIDVEMRLRIPLEQAPPRRPSPSSPKGRSGARPLSKQDRLRSLGGDRWGLVPDEGSPQERGWPARVGLRTLGGGGRLAGHQWGVQLGH